MYCGTPSIHAPATLRALVARPIAQMRRLDSADERAPEMYFMAGLYGTAEHPVGSPSQNCG